MLLRKRAWDMMREEFVQIGEDNTLAEAIGTMREAMRETPETQIVIVTDLRGRLKGAVSIWDVLKAVENSVLKDENLKLTEETDWDQAFARACRICTQADLPGHFEGDIPTVKPHDPLLVVLETFLSRKMNWVVVEENNKPIGIIYSSDLFRELSRDMVKAF